MFKIILKNNCFSLKVIALIAMTIDHIGVFIFPEWILLRIIGRISFPLFAFTLAKSLNKSSNPKKIVIKLLLFGFIIEFFMYMLAQVFIKNIFLTLGLGSFACYLFKRDGTIKYFVLIPFILVAFNLVKIEYGIYGMLLLFGFYFLKDHNFYSSIYLIVITLLFIVIDSTLSLQIFALLSAPLIMNCNNKRGYYSPISKYFFYIYYPLHIIIIYLLSMI